MQPYIPMDTLKIITEKPVDEVFNVLFVIAKAACLVAPITMIIIQMVKVPLRRFFHTKKVTAWLSGYSYPILPTTYLFLPAFMRRGRDIRKAETTKDKKELLNTLIRLSTAGNYYALFQLSIEQLCGQLLAAVQTVLNDPRSHRELLIALVHPQKSDSLNSDIDVLAPAEYNGKPYSTKMSKQQEQNYLAARSKVQSAIQRNIDSLQISANVEWRAWLKFTSTLISAVIAACALLLSGIHGYELQKVFILIVVALIAGYAASVLRDVIAVIEKLRG